MFPRGSLTYSHYAKATIPQLYVRQPNGRYAPYTPPKEPSDPHFYRRVGNRYIPMGLTHYSDHNLSEGLWLVRNRPGCHSMTNVEHYASRWGLTQVADIPITDASRFAAADELHRAIDNFLFHRFGYTVGDVPHQDLSDELVKLIMNINPDNQ